MECGCFAVSACSMLDLRLELTQWVMLGTQAGLTIRKDSGAGGRPRLTGTQLQKLRLHAKTYSGRLPLHESSYHGTLARCAFLDGFHLREPSRTSYVERSRAGGGACHS